MELDAHSRRFARGPPLSAARLVDARNFVGLLDGGSDRVASGRPWGPGSLRL